MKRRPEGGFGSGHITGSPEKLTRIYQQLTAAGFKLDSVLYVPIPDKKGRYVDEIDEQVAEYATAVYDDLVETHGKNNLTTMQASPKVAQEHHFTFGPNIVALLFDLHGTAELKLSNYR